MTIYCEECVRLFEYLRFLPRYGVIANVCRRQPGYGRLDYAALRRVEFMLPPWTEKLNRPIRDRVDDVTLHTCEDARRYIEAIPAQRPMSIQWHVAAQLLMHGADAEAVTGAIELALRYEGRLDENGER